MTFQIRFFIFFKILYFNLEKELHFLYYFLREFDVSSHSEKLM